MTVSDLDPGRGCSGGGAGGGAALPAAGGEGVGRGHRGRPPRGRGVEPHQCRQVRHRGDTVMSVSCH